MTGEPGSKKSYPISLQWGKSQVGVLGFTQPGYHHKGCIGLVQQSALIRFCGRLGDGLLFQPALSWLVEQCPHTKFTVLVEEGCLPLQSLWPDSVQVIIQPWPDDTDVGLRTWFETQSDQFDWFWSTSKTHHDVLSATMAGISFRFGYNTGPMSRQVLTQAFELDHQSYMATHYMTLAQVVASQRGVLVEAPKLQSEVLPQLGSEYRQTDHSGARSLRFTLHAGCGRAALRQGIDKRWLFWDQVALRLLTEYPQSSVVLVEGPEDQAWETLNSQDEQAAGVLKDAAPRFERVTLTNTDGFKALNGLKEVLALTSVFLGTDSFPMHLSVAMGIPTLGVFSATNPHQYLPNQPWCRAAFRQDLACRPCLWTPRVVMCDQPVCLKVPEGVILDHLKALMLSLSSQIPVS